MKKQKEINLNSLLKYFMDDKILWKDKIVF